MDAVDPISGDRDDHVSHEHCGAHSTVATQSAFASGEGVCNWTRVCSRTPNWAPEKQKKMPIRTRGRGHWHLLPGVEHRQGALDHVRHSTASPDSFLTYSRSAASLGITAKQPSELRPNDRRIGRAGRRSWILAGHDPTVN